MTHTGDEVTHQKRPSAPLFEPRVNARKAFRREVKKPAVFHEYIGVENAAEQIADCYAAGAPEECRSESGQEEECALVDQIAGECQQPLVGHRQTHDAKYKQRKDSSVAVLRNPLEGGVSHP